MFLDYFYWWLINFTINGVCFKCSWSRACLKYFLIAVTHPNTVRQGRCFTTFIDWLINFPINSVCLKRSLTSDTHSSSDCLNYFLAAVTHPGRVRWQRRLSHSSVVEMSIRATVFACEPTTISAGGWGLAVRPRHLCARVVFVASGGWPKTRGRA